MLPRDRLAAVARLRRSTPNRAADRLRHRAVGAFRRGVAMQVASDHVASGCIRCARVADGQTHTSREVEALIRSHPIAGAGNPPQPRVFSLRRRRDSGKSGLPCADDSGTLHAGQDENIRVPRGCVQELLRRFSPIHPLRGVNIRGGQDDACSDRLCKPVRFDTGHRAANWRQAPRRWQRRRCSLSR